MVEEKQGYYLYSVIAGEHEFSFGPIGLSEKNEGEEVFTISCDGLACVVSRSSIKKWEVNRKNTVQHAKVNEEVMKNHVVLPIRFCTISESLDEIVEKFLKPKSEELREKLHYMSDKLEYGVRGFWFNLEKIYTGLLNEFPKLKEKRNQLAKIPFEKARNDMIILGQKVQNTLQQKKEALENKLFNKLQLFAVESKKNKLIGDQLVLNGAFLIENINQLEFDTQVEALVKEYEETAQFKYVGPTPPVNFIEIVVHF